MVLLSKTFKEYAALSQPTTNMDLKKVCRYYYEDMYLSLDCPDRTPAFQCHVSFDK